MVDSIKAAVDARSNPGFVIMAQTDALQGEGIESTKTLSPQTSASMLSAPGWTRSRSLSLR